MESESEKLKKEIELLQKEKNKLTATIRDIENKISSEHFKRQRINETLYSFPEFIYIITSCAFFYFILSAIIRLCFRL